MISSGAEDGMGEGLLWDAEEPSRGSLAHCHPKTIDTRHALEQSFEPLLPARE